MTCIVINSNEYQVSTGSTELEYSNLGCHASYSI